MRWPTLASNRARTSQSARSTAQGRADFSIPSLTSLSSPDPKPYLSVCLEWMTAGVHRRWQGPLLVQPEEVELAIRQSTVPDIDQTLIPSRVLGAQAMD